MGEGAQEQVQGVWKSGRGNKCEEYGRAGVETSARSMGERASMRTVQCLICKCAQELLCMSTVDKNGVSTNISLSCAKIHEDSFVRVSSLFRSSEGLAVTTCFKLRRPLLSQCLA